MRPAILTAAAAVAASLCASLGASASLAAPPPPTPTRDFVQAAANSDQFEINEAQVALIEGRDPRVRAFAQQMIQDHRELGRRLRQTVTTAGLPSPDVALSGDQAMLLSGLQGQSGPQFDKTYVRHQVLGHQQALVVEQGYADGGQNAAVQQAARSALPVIQQHLDMARQLCASLGCNS